MGGGTPGVELDGLVSDNRGLVGTGGGRELGGGRGALAVAVGVDGVDPEKLVAIFLNLENRLPFDTFPSVSVEEVGKGSADGAARKGRSLREDCASCGGAVFEAVRAGLGAIIGARGSLVCETLPVAGTCGGGSGDLHSETLRWWAAGVGVGVGVGVGGRDDRGTGGRGRWRGPDGGNGGGIISSWCIGSSVCAIFCEIGSGGCNSGPTSASSSSSCGPIPVGVFRPTSPCDVYP